MAFSGRIEMYECERNKKNNKEKKGNGVYFKTYSCENTDTKRN